MGINMGNFFRGVVYTGLAAITGVAGYMFGKYKHMNGKVSLTMIGLALVLYAPKGCDVAETYLKTHAEVEKVRVYGAARKDSIDAVIRSEERKDSTLYLKQFFQNADDLRKNLEDKYQGMIQANEQEYKKLLNQNNVQYTSTLNNMIKQNDVLKKSVEDLKSAQPALNANTTTASANSSSQPDVSNTSPLIDQRKTSTANSNTAQRPNYNFTPKVIKSEVLADGTEISVVQDKDGHITQYISRPNTNNGAARPRKGIFR